MEIGSSTLYSNLANMSASNITIAPINPLNTMVLKLFLFNINFAICGAISPTNEISPVTHIIAATRSVDNNNIMVRTIPIRIPNARHSLSLNASISICLRNRIIPITPTQNSGNTVITFAAVVLPNVPISQYSIAASSFSGSAKYLSPIMTALETAFITIPAST